MVWFSCCTSWAKKRECESNGILYLEFDWFVLIASNMRSRFRNHLFYDVHYLEFFFKFRTRTCPSYFRINILNFTGSS